MTQKVVFFENIKDLERLTVRTEKELRDAGFDLDDMDFGFVTDKEWKQDGWDDNDPYYESWLLFRAEQYCVGYEHKEFNGKHYYMVYHS